MEIIQKNPSLRNQIILEEVYEDDYEKKKNLDKELNLLPKFISLKNVKKTIKPNSNFVEVVQ